MFQLKGYTATGLNEILRESGAPRGSLYYYFPNGKEQLALAAVELAGKSMREKVSSSLSRHREPVRAIAQVIQDMTAALRDDGKLQTMSLSMIALETCQTSDLLREACARSFTKMAALYSEKLQKSGFDAEQSANLGSLLQSMIEGAITLSITEKDTAPLDTILQFLPTLIR